MLLRTALQVICPQDQPRHSFLQTVVIFCVFVLVFMVINTHKMVIVRLNAFQGYCRHA